MQLILTVYELHRQPSNFLDVLLKEYEVPDCPVNNLDVSGIIWSRQWKRKPRRN